MFLSFTLCDADAKEKISETYYVDINDDETIGKIVKGGICREGDTNTKFAIFKVEKRDPNIVMIVELTKVLEGNEENIDVNMEVITIDGLSAHAGRKELLDFINKLGYIDILLNIFDFPIPNQRSTLLDQSPGFGIVLAKIGHCE